MLEHQRLVAAPHVRDREAGGDDIVWDSIRVEIEDEFEVDTVLAEFGANVRDAVGEAAHRQHEDRIDLRVDAVRSAGTRLRRAHDLRIGVDDAGYLLTHCRK